MKRNLKTCHSNNNNKIREKQNTSNKTKEGRENNENKHVFKVLMEDKEAKVMMINWSKKK